MTMLRLLFTVNTAITAFVVSYSVVLSRLLLTSLSEYYLHRSGVETIFFFSSRRRHTRLQGDWSSDVCSSDLPEGTARHRPRNERLRTEPVLEEGVGRLGAQLRLTIHVRKHLDGRTPRQVPAFAGHDHDRENDDAKNEEQIAHDAQSLTSSTWVEPAPSSSRRVSTSLNFGSVAPMAMKNRSWVTGLNRSLLKSGGYQRGNW